MRVVKALCVFPFRGRGTHSLKLYFFLGRALSKRSLFVKSCLQFCNGFFVRRQLLLVFSILLFCLLLLYTYPFGLPSLHGLLFR